MNLSLCIAYDPTIPGCHVSPDGVHVVDLEHDGQSMSIMLNREQADALCDALCHALQDSDPTAPPLEERGLTPPAEEFAPDHVHTTAAGRHYLHGTGAEVGRVTREAYEFALGVVRGNATDAEVESAGRTIDAYRAQS